MVKSFNISPPRVTCVFMTAYSSSVSLPGLFKIASGIPILPISCSSAIWRRFSHFSFEYCSLFAIATEYSDTRKECSLVLESFASTVRAMERMVSFPIWICFFAYSSSYFCFSSVLCACVLVMNHVTQISTSPAIKITYNLNHQFWYISVSFSIL